MAATSDRPAPMPVKTPTPPMAAVRAAAREMCRLAQDVYHDDMDPDQERPCRTCSESAHVAVQAGMNWMVEWFLRRMDQHLLSLAVWHAPDGLADPAEISRADRAAADTLKVEAGRVRAAAYAYEVAARQQDAEGA